MATTTKRWSKGEVQWDPSAPLSSVTVNGSPLRAGDGVKITWTTGGTFEIDVHYDGELPPPLSLGSVWHTPGCYRMTVVGQPEELDPYISGVVWDDGPTVRAGKFLPSELHQPGAGMCYGR